MKIKLSSIYASPNCTAHPGAIIDVSAEEGTALIAGGFGLKIDEQPEPVAASPVGEEAGEPETAALAPAENAAGKKPRKRPAS